MIIISLKKLVEDYDINTVQVSIGIGVAPLSFDVDSQEYRDQEKFLVKGEYKIFQDPATGKQILLVEKLEEGINITLNKPTIVAEDVAPEEEAKLEEFINTEITAVVFNRSTLASAGRETKRKFVTAYADSVVESYRKNFGSAEREEFAVIEIDWSNKTVSLKSIAEPIPEEESDTIGEDQPSTGG